MKELEYILDYFTSHGLRDYLYKYITFLRVYSNMRVYKDVQFAHGLQVFYDTIRGENGNDASE